MAVRPAGWLAAAAAGLVGFTVWHWRGAARGVDHAEDTTPPVIGVIRLPSDHPGWTPVPVYIGDPPFGTGDPPAAIGDPEMYYPVDFQPHPEQAGHDSWHSREDW